MSCIGVMKPYTWNIYLRSHMCDSVGFLFVMIHLDNIYMKVSEIFKDYGQLLLIGGVLIMILIRDAKENDIWSIAKIKIDAWRSTYRGIISDNILDSFKLSEQVKMFKMLTAQENNQNFLVLAEVDGTIAGFAAGGAEREGKHGVDGEIYAVYILEEYQNQGLGKMLMEYSVEKLKNEGFNSMVVWALENNPYKRFYEKHGGIQIGRKLLEMDGEEQFVTAYVWRDLRGGFR